MSTVYAKSPPLYHPWVTAEACMWMADPVQLDYIIDTLGYHNELTGALAPPILFSISICDGPNGMPCVAVQEWHEPSPPSSVNLTHGPFVYEWDGLDFVFLADASSDGGLGSEQVTGTAMNETGGTPGVTQNWLQPSGTYTMRVYSRTVSPAPIQNLTFDGVSLYADWSHVEATAVSGAITRVRAYWMVKEWDGANWTQLGDENTHQAQATSGSSPIAGWGSVNFGQKLLASAEDEGHPYMLYIDRTLAAGPTTVDTLYCSRWDGSAWDDLGSLTMPTSGLSLFTEGVDFSLGEDGNPTVIWRDTDLTPITLVINTWNGTSWDQLTPDLQTILGVIPDLSVFKLSIAPYEPALDRFLIALICDVTADSDRVYVLEYYPGTATVQPAFNDTTKARVGDNTSNPTPFWVTMMVEEEGTYWLFLHQGGTGPGDLWRYDANCGEGWERISEPDIDPPYGGLSSPAKAYIKDGHIYQGILIADVDDDNRWQGHVVDDYTIECEPCEP